MRAAAALDQRVEVGGDDRGRGGRGHCAATLPRCAAYVSAVVNSDASTWAPSKSFPGAVSSSRRRPRTSAEVLATPLTIYVGFDPSAPSLHAGNLVPLMLMTHLRRAGHQVIALVGGATGMIGDPSGKSSERKLLGNDEVDRQHARAARADRDVLRQRRGPAGQDGRQPRLAGQADAARLPARRRQALRGQPDDPARLGQPALRVARGGDLVHRVLVHAAAGVRLPRAATGATAAACSAARPTSGGTSCRASIWCGASRGRPSTA